MSGTKSVSRKRVVYRCPDWAKDAIWYQIFPERFRNGCPASNPLMSDFSDRPAAEWTVTPWGADWYEQASWEKPMGDFYRSVYARRYGGDLVGLRDKLDYLQELGVNALYLNPVFRSPSLHKYDGACFHHIDPAFGPDREGDIQLIARAGETEHPGTWIWTAADRFFLDLVKEIHRRGMRIILDGVFNHMGTRSFAFLDLLKYGRKSRYKDWFRITKWKKDGSFEYEGWFGHKMLPELGRNARNLAAPVRDYIFNSTRRWMMPCRDGHAEEGIDGWRLDVAFCVPHAFWRGWRKLVKQLNPDAYLTGEIVGYAEEFLRGDEFDAVMNYMWLYPALAFFTPNEQALSARTFRKRLDELRKKYPRQAAYVLQNLLDSHDTGRVLTLLENRCPPFETWDHYFSFPRAKDHPDLVTTRPGPEAFAALRQMVVFQMTYVGAPMIYYGTEVGLWGANDPDNRQPMLWSDVSYAPEARAPRGACPPHPRQPDRALFNFYRRAIRLRREQAALRRGSLRWLPHPNERVVGFERILGPERVRVWLNTSSRAGEIDCPGKGIDLWTGKPVKKGRLAVKPRGWKIIRWS